MVKKQLTRKEFVSRTLGGIAGIGIFGKHMHPESAEAFTLKNVGETGIMVSPFCFGATRTSEESLIKYVISKGINFIDTGRSYANGNNERLIGQTITSFRRNVIIQSKIRLEDNELPSKGKGKKGAEEIRTVLYTKMDECLKALKTDYIDIMLYHDAASENLLFHSSVLEFYSDMKKNGVIKACGFSTHNDKMNLIERNNNERFFDTIMVPFNHKGSFIHSQTGNYSEWDQTKLISLLTEAGKKGIGVVAMKTCSGGKYSPASGIEPSFKEAVKWVLSHEFISSAAVAMANFEQVDEFSSQPG